MDKPIGAVDIPGYIDFPNFLPTRILCHKDQKGNITDRFADFDSPELYQMNLKKTPPDWHYRNKEVTYIMNSNGYRAPEWKDMDWQESVVIFGCSNVAGIGLAEDETIHHYLSTILNRPVIAIGAPGASINFCFYNSVILSECYPEPYAVIQLWSTLDRCTSFSGEEIINGGPWDDDNKFFREYNETDYNPPIHAKLTSIASKNLWKDRCRYYSASYFDRTAYYTDCEHVEIDNEARDLLHPGRKNSITMAKLIAENII